MATASTANGPLSVNTRKNDFGCRIWLGRNGLQMDCLANAYNSGKRPQAGGFSSINGAGPPPVKGSAKSLFLKVTFTLRQPNQRPRSRSSTSEVANPSAGSPAWTWNARSASRVMPPSWPSGVPL